LRWIRLEKLLVVTHVCSRFKQRYIAKVKNRNKLCITAFFGGPKLLVAKCFLLASKANHQKIVHRLLNRMMHVLNFLMIRNFRKQASNTPTLLYFSGRFKAISK
jgi:hypothetical protein